MMMMIQVTCFVFRHEWTKSTACSSTVMPDCVPQFHRVFLVQFYNSFSSLHWPPPLNLLTSWTI